MYVDNGSIESGVDRESVKTSENFEGVGCVSVAEIGFHGVVWKRVNIKD